MALLCLPLLSTTFNTPLVGSQSDALSLLHSAATVGYLQSIPKVGVCCAAEQGVVIRRCQHLCTNLAATLAGSGYNNTMKVYTAAFITVIYQSFQFSKATTILVKSCLCYCTALDCQKPCTWSGEICRISLMLGCSCFIYSENPDAKSTKLDLSA